LQIEMSVQKDAPEQINSTMGQGGVPCDLHGRPFSCAVDAEHKATELQICSFKQPHMRTFHASWMGFFSTFFSTFAPAPLAAYLKREDTLGLTAMDIGNGNIASVAVTIIFRVIVGVVCDVLGARRGLAFLLFLACPGILGMMFVQSGAAFVAMRAVIGCGLATFVCCQVWCSQQFSKNVVGAANATAAGWGNLGGGVTNALTPVVFNIMMAATSKNIDLAWRLTFLLPLAMHLVTSLVVLSGRDLPDGQFKELEQSGAKQKGDGSIVLKVGFSNVNAWLMTIAYGMCFGIELTMNNIGALFFHSYFGMSVTVAGAIASIWGATNLFARSIGGFVSDYMNKNYGVRGRLWAYWFVQTLEGSLCVILSLITLGLDAPHGQGDATLTPYAQVDGEWVAFEPSGEKKYLLAHCHVNEEPLTDELKAQFPADSVFQGLSKVVLLEPPAPHGNGTNCICNSGTAPAVVALLFCFSVCVQAAEGLSFGIVPYISRPALGVVSGMVGAGGNGGAVAMLNLFFKGHPIRKDKGILNMGLTIVILTCATVIPVYMPEHGGMFFKAGALGSYDPQILKPPADYRGADSVIMAEEQKPADKAADGEVTV
jgi:nitrate/nitrite transporter NarK